MVKRNTQIKSFICFVAAAVLLVALAGSPCMADVYEMALGDTLTRTLTVFDGTIIAGPVGSDWGDDSTSFTSTVTRSVDDPSAPLHYYYEFSVPEGAKDLSHLILQVSEADGDLLAFDPTNPLDYLNGPTVAEGKTDTFGPADGNPGFPTGKSIFGIKFEDEMPMWVIEFDSYRLPMDGSFYTKSASDIYAYNSGLGDGDAFIYVPDTSYVPVPGAVLLGILGLGAVGLKLRKYA